LILSLNINYSVMEQDKEGWASLTLDSFQVPDKFGQD
jgi:hypothetical protein